MEKKTNLNIIAISLFRYIRKRNIEKNTKLKTYNMKH